MALSRKARRYSRVVAYCLILASILALFNTALQAVSSQTFDTSTSTENSADTAQTNTTTNATELVSTSTETTKTTTIATSTSTAIQFTIAYATSTLHVTIYNVQYTTTNNVFTIVNVKFTTITTSITQVESVQPVGAPSLPIHSSTSSGAPSIAADALLGHRDAGLTLQSIAASVVLIILLASILSFAERGNRQPPRPTYLNEFTHENRAPFTGR